MYILYYYSILLWSIHTWKSHFQSSPRTTLAPNFKYGIISAPRKHFILFKSSSYIICFVFIFSIGRFAARSKALIMELIVDSMLELINKLDSFPFKICVIDPNVAIANLKLHTFKIICKQIINKVENHNSIKLPAPSNFFNGCYFIPNPYWFLNFSYLSNK